MTLSTRDKAALMLSYPLGMMKITSTSIGEEYPEIGEIINCSINSINNIHAYHIDAVLMLKSIDDITDDHAMTAAKIMNVDVDFSEKEESDPDTPMDKVGFIEFLKSVIDDGEQLKDFTYRGYAALLKHLRYYNYNVPHEILDFKYPVECGHAEYVKE